MTRIDSFVSEDVSNVESDYEGELDSDKVTHESFYFLGTNLVKVHLGHAFAWSKAMKNNWREKNGHSTQTFKLKI